MENNTSISESLVSISAKHKLTEERILSILDFEINQIKSEQERNGWTKWALYGVLGGSLWLLLEQWEKGDFDFEVVLILILVFSIGLDILRQSSRLLPFSPPRYDKTLRFKFINEITNGGAFFLYAIRHPIIFSIALYFSNRVFWIQATIVLAYYGWYSIFSLLAFIAQYSSISEVIYNSKSKMNLPSYYITWSLTLVLLLVGMTDFLNAALNYSENIQIANFRIAGLLVVIGYIFYLLLHISEKFPLLNRLTDIRHDLSFGRIDLETANKRAEFIIAGIPLNERLQEDINALLPLVDQKKSDFDLIHSEIMVLSKEIPTEKNKITMEQKNEAKEILLQCSKRIKNMLKRNDEAEKVKFKLKLHISMVERESPQSAQSAKDFLIEIEKMETILLNKADSLFAELNPLLKRLVD